MDVNVNVVDIGDSEGGGESKENVELTILGQKIANSEAETTEIGKNKPILQKARQQAYKKRVNKRTKSASTPSYLSIWYQWYGHDGTGAMVWYRRDASKACTVPYRWYGLLVR